MKRNFRWVLSIAMGLMTLGGPGLIHAQTDPYEAELRRLYNDPSRFEQLSGAARSLLERKFGRRGPPATPVPAAEPAEVGGAPLAPATVTVNDPTLDGTAQDTQSESAVLAVPGGIVVSAFNDSGSCVPSCVVTQKFTGYSRSTSGGASFSDLGALPTVTGGDGGDPVLARSDASGFIFLVTLMHPASLVSGLQCFRSFDNGATWPSVSNCGPGSSGFQDKPWITVDNRTGSGNGHVYVAWSDFGSTPGIRFARSINGGLTYEPSPGILLWPDGQGANVVVGTDHAVYVFSWQGTTPQSIQVRKSTDFGVSFGAAVTVATDLNTTGVNGDLGLDGGFHSNSFPQAAVNPVSGHIYVVYNRIFSGQDTDIRLRRSTDSGATWGASISVGFSSLTDWSPSIAVADGTTQRIMISWYQKPSDGTTTGNIINRVGNFVDGVTFTELPGIGINGFGDSNITTSPFPIVVGQDPAVAADYMGDYDQSDGDSTYFYQPWGDNTLAHTPFHAHQPDVRFSKFYVLGPPFTTNAAVLPLSRSHTLGSSVKPTAFAAIINAGDAVAVACRVAAPSSPPAGLGTFTFQTADSSNALTGTPDTPVNIAPGTTQNFVFAFNPPATGPEIPAGTSLAMRFLCDNVADAPQFAGVNNFIIGTSFTPIPDPVALVSTPTGDGVVRIPSSFASQFFAIGTSNLGASGTITVFADTGGVSLPLTLTVCETNPILGTCLAPPTPSVTVVYLASTSKSFAFLAQATGSIPLVPQTNRVFPKLVEGPTTTGPLRGAASAAVCTKPNLGC